TDEEAVAAAFTPATRLLHLESPTNPTMRLCDIPRLCRLAHEHGALVVVDNTFASPWLQRPLSLGADLVYHSTTKFLNGHSDSVGGIVVAKSPEHLEWLAFVQNSAGDPVPVRFLARAARHQDARRSHGTARAERPRDRSVSHDASEDPQDQLPGAA